MPRATRNRVNYFERACIYATMGDVHLRDQEISACYMYQDQAKFNDLLVFHDWLDKYDRTTQKAVRLKMYSPEHLRRLFDEYKPGDELRRKYLRYVLQADLSADSAGLLIEEENDPPIMLHALRQLLKRKAPNTLEVMEALIESGRLSYIDGIDLLKLDEEFSLSQLGRAVPSISALPLLSGLLQGKQDLTLVLGGSSNDMIVNLAGVEKDQETIKTYLGILAARADERVVDLTVDRVQEGLLSDEEAIELLGRNARFWTEFLTKAKSEKAGEAQASGLARLFPLELGVVSAGLLVKTPIGWARIEGIEDSNGKELPSIPLENRQVRFRISFNADQPRVAGVLDLQREELTLAGSMPYFQCGKCNLIAPDQHFILGEHTRQQHSGIGPSVRRIPSHMQIYGDLKYQKQN